MSSNPCGCGVTEDGKIIMCPRHFKILMQDEDLAEFMKNNGG